MGLLGSMSVRFMGDTGNLVNAVTGAKSAISSFAQAHPVMAATGGLILGLGAMAVGFGVASIKAAADFQSGMSKVQAYAGLTQSQTDSLGNSILSLATQMGQSPKAMADALYPIISSGYSASQSLDILKLSAMTAAASGANMATVADALTTSLKAMHAPASAATTYMDMINKMVSLGKGQVSDYAAVIGKLALAAGSAKVPFNDMAASLATLTTHGFPSVAQASTSLGNLFTQIGPKVDTLAQHAKKLGLSFDENKFKTDSLSQKLAYLQEITHGNQGELLKLVGGSTVALKAFNALEGSGTDWTDNLKAMKNTTGETAGVFNKTYGDWNNSTARLSATFQVLEIKVGQALLPVLTKMLNSVTPIIASIADWETKTHGIENAIGFLGDVINKVSGFMNTIPPTFVQAYNTLQSTWGKVGVFFTNAWNTVTTSFTNAKNTINGAISSIMGFYERWKVPILAVTGAITLFFLPAMIKAGVEAAISGAKITANFVRSMIQTGIEATKSGAITSAQFIKSMIQSGIEAVKNGAIVTANFVKSMILTGVEAVRQGAIVTANFIKSMIQTGIEGWAAAGKLLTSMIPAFIKTGVEAVVAGAKVTATFIASMYKAGVQAVITAGQFMASLIPSIIAFAAEALTAAATAIPAILVGFGAWIVGAAGVAIANIAAFWPIYLVVLIIVAVIALVVLAIMHWGAIAGWISEAWVKVKAFFVTLWGDIKSAFSAGIAWIGGAINAAAAFIYHWLIYPYVLMYLYIMYFWNLLQYKIQVGMAVVRGILQNIGGTLYNIFIKPFADAYTFISGILGKISGLISNLLGTASNIGHNIGSTLHIPGMASGGISGGGLTLVGERGPELVMLPQGARVYPSGTGPSTSSSSSSGTSGSQTIIIQLDSTELARITGDRQARMVRLKMGRRAA